MQTNLIQCERQQGIYTNKPFTLSLPSGGEIGQGCREERIFNQESFLVLSPIHLSSAVSVHDPECNADDEDAEAGYMRLEMLPARLLA